ncbi:MAG: ArsA-related P-loop ATPase, partial [Myxococcota bacterium]|nr:ArsA-related P-loop ATPase [Myxococcota bacterium]
MNISQLLERKLVMITGKGGTGKTTMSMALGTLAAEQGRRVVLVEVDANRSAFARIHGVNPGFEPTPIVEGVWAVNVRWHDALEEWLTATLKRNRIVKLVLGNRFVQLFLDATPGARELVVLSKVLTLSEEWDLVVVDLPASGHAMSLLRVPEVARSLMSSGPIRQRAEKILAMLRDRDTVLVLVALPEEMVVNETVELWTRIRSEVPEVIAPVVILNRA